MCILAKNGVDTLIAVVTCLCLVIVVVLVLIAAVGGRQIRRYMSQQTFAIEEMRETQSAVVQVVSEMTDSASSRYLKDDDDDDGDNLPPVEAASAAASSARHSTPNSGARRRGPPLWVPSFNMPGRHFLLFPMSEEKRKQQKQKGEEFEMQERRGEKEKGANTSLDEGEERK